ncbi:MAG: alcohol dehydrogenase catalytic domain-containing protein [Pirellula sp.]
MKKPSFAPKLQVLCPRPKAIRTMKALVKHRRDVGLELQDVPFPEFGINDCLIQVEKTGICGTDLHIYNWDAWAQKTIPVPMVVGHEFVGTIVEVGSNVKDFFPGDVVSGEGHVVCGRCRNCCGSNDGCCNNWFCLFGKGCETAYLTVRLQRSPHRSL